MVTYWSDWNVILLPNQPSTVGVCGSWLETNSEVNVVSFLPYIYYTTYVNALMWSNMECRVTWNSEMNTARSTLCRFLKES